ncbi:hypothetical protein F0562_001767 [Nyssa sinensis]|uniref:Uncharacterized protein n=1 Tax=Nyssa sinensis TaxID=561372 RepID=A0A5J5C3X6_9ASTE|nr:hypothetical protein F0562_001767 [Nyssa sinensis]
MGFSNSIWSEGSNIRRSELLDDLVMPRLLMPGSELLLLPLASLELLHQSQREISTLEGPTWFEVALREKEGGVQNMHIEEDRPGSSITPSEAEPHLASSQAEWIQPELRQAGASQSELFEENLKDLNDSDLT